MTREYHSIFASGILASFCERADRRFFIFGITGSLRIPVSSVYRLELAGMSLSILTISLFGQRR
jgi:hypothetical protein